MCSKWKDGRTDRQYDANSSFSQFCERAQKSVIMTVRPNIEFEWPEFLLRIQEASDSIHGPHTGYFLLNSKGEMLDQ